MIELLKLFPDQSVICLASNKKQPVSICTREVLRYPNSDKTDCKHFKGLVNRTDRGLVIQCNYEPLLSAKYIDAIDKYTSENSDEHCEEGSRVIAVNNINGFINEIISIYVESNRNAQKE